MRLLKDVKIGKLVLNIDENAFKDQNNLETVSLNSSYIIKNPSLKNIFGDLVKYYIIEDGVNSSIGLKAFYECTNLESLIIGKNVLGIGELALYGCTSLSSIEIPSNIKNIDASALANCGSDSKPLNIIFESENPKINLVDSNSNIIYAFGEINSDGNLPIKIYVPINFEQIYAENDDGWKYYSLFINNLNLNIFYYGETISRTYDTTISSDSVVDKSNLSKVQLGIKVTNIADGAFADCNNLTAVVWNAKNCSDSGQFGSQVKFFVFGSEVENIPNLCCENMSNLTSIKIPNSVTIIGERAFSYCSGLTSVTIGNSVESIGSYAFMWCTNLTSITIANGVTSIGDYAFYGCSGLTSPVYNAHVFAFMPTSYSGAYTIPDGIESIAGSAFLSCLSLTSVTIPNSVTSIGNNAFFYCTGLTSIICEAITPPTLGGTSVFNNTNDCSICVPSQSVDNYKTSWSIYKSRIYEIPKL